MTQPGVRSSHTNRFRADGGAGPVRGYAERVSSASALFGRLRANSWTVEIVLAAVVAIGSILGVWSELAASPDPYPAVWGAFASAFVASGILVFRQSWPILVAIGAIAVVLIYHLLGYPGESPGLVFFFAFYSVACYGRGTRSLLIGLGLALVATVIPTLPPHSVPLTSFAVLGPTVGFAWMVVVGAAAGQRRRSSDARIERAALDAETRIREGLVEERLRIARDLHDVLAHTLSAISVQSGVAIDSLPARPNVALDALHAVRSLAKAAMPELRVTLTALRGSDDELLNDVSPQPRLSEIAGIADQARHTGLAVAVTLPEDTSQLSQFSEVTAYRIVQESVTNVIRHAGARSVQISIAISDGLMSIDVTDDGTGDKSIHNEGLGIRGMRERAELVGGTLTTTRDALGGFHVRAELPVASG
jgi:signal transduction histidine kinase